MAPPSDFLLAGVRVIDAASFTKRGLALDLRQPDGRAVLYRLVERADVFVTNTPLDSRARYLAGDRVVKVRAR